MKQKLAFIFSLLLMVIFGSNAAFATVSVPTFTISTGVGANSNSAISASSVILSGTKNSGDTLAYTVSIQTGSSTPILSTFAPSASATTWQKTIVGLNGGTTYTFTVTATDTTTGDYSVSLPATFTAQSVSDVPTNLKAVSVQNGINLSWTAPANTGGVPLTNYSLQDNKGGSKITIPGTSTSYSATGLSPGSAVTYTLVANNAIGSSTTVSFNPVTVSSVPSAPDQPTATLSGSDITVNWSAPSNNGGTPVTGYAVTLTSSTGGTDSDSPHVLSQANLTSYTFHSVPAGTWTATVAATNAIGTGLPSAASNSEVIAGAGSPSPSPSPSPSVTPTPTPTPSPTQSSGGSNQSSNNSNSGNSGSGVVPAVIPPAPSLAHTATPTASPTPSPSESASASQSPAPVNSPVAQPTPTVSSLIAPKPAATTSAPTPPVPSAAAKVIAPGLSVSGTKPLANEVITVSSKPSTTISSAPNVNLKAGNLSAPKISALPKSTSISVTITVGGKSVSLGTVKTSSNGVIQLPGVNLAKAGTYVVALKDPKGVTHYVKLVVGAKK